ncbi:MAG: TIM barrel protein [Phycisphaerae bacterium]|nr:TIM barrel protein [Phycisphaerae bacterium]
MLLTLNASCLRDKLLSSTPGGVSLDSLPRFARDVIGVHGLYLSTELLKGADRKRLEQMRERADKAGCAVLLLQETAPAVLTTPAKADAAVERLTRVVEAASALGAAAISVRLEAGATPAAVESAVARLKEVAKAADARDVNVLIAPGPGLTDDPDRVTEIIKKVGGFRIGTCPDFESALTHKNPGAFLRRLTPYATALVANTVQFEEGEPTPPPVRPKSKPEAASAKGKPADVDDEDLDEEMSPEDLLAALAPEEDEEEPEPEPALIHRPYDLAPLLESVLAVGYEGSIGLDYRGSGDATTGLIQSRRAIQRILDAQA